LGEESHEKFLLKTAKQSFYNTSEMNMSRLGSSDIKANLPNLSPGSVRSRTEQPGLNKSGDRNKNNRG